MCYVTLRNLEINCNVVQEYYYQMNYFCDISGVDISSPQVGITSHKGTGDVCTAGSECPIGSALPNPCAAGTYSPDTGYETCLDCPAGRIVSKYFLGLIIV